jgi:hypothetical protein
VKLIFKEEFNMASQKDNLGESNAKKENNTPLARHADLSRLQCIKINLYARKWFRSGNI